MAHAHRAHRRSLLDERCVRHQFEEAVDRCRQCGNGFCGQCLVYAFGDRQPPFCIPCALAASGVRSGGSRMPVVPKKEMKRREKEARRLAEQAEAADSAAAAASTQIDWSLPVNGTDPNLDPSFPRFEEAPAPDLQPQAPPAATKGRGLFRRKGKVVPF